MSDHYDYLIVGAGLFGSVFAHVMKKAGKNCLVLERRPLPGGNIRTEERDGIHLHLYGPHIFHTDDKTVWKLISGLTEFNSYVYSPIACYRGEFYNLPFNMNTFYAMWGVKTPHEALARIDKTRPSQKRQPRNLEEQAISMVGTDIYNKLVKGYTEKQWGKKCSELPPEIIKRLPLRFTFDNNYFNSRYQGIPIEGYSKLIENLLKGVNVICDVDFLLEKEKYAPLTDKIVYTGALDEYYGYRFGALEYRSLRFETERLDMENYQGTTTVNYTDANVPYTRIIEHKHFTYGKQSVTYITREYPVTWTPGAEPYYPVNDAKNNALYARYAALAESEDKLLLGGRLAEYKYYDMDKIVAVALALVQKEDVNFS